MATNKKISELTQVANVTGEELIPFVLDGQNKVVKAKHLKGANNLGADYVDIVGDDGITYRCKVVNVTENGLFLNHPNSIKATILLPPTQAIIADADDDIQTFQALYYNYLISDEVTEFISIVLYVLYTGVNVLIYILLGNWEITSEIV